MISIKIKDMCIFLIFLHKVCVEFLDSEELKMSNF